MNTMFLVFGAVASAGAGFLAGYGSIYLFNRIPAKWLCDYDEEPDERHLAPRISKYPLAPILSVIFAWAVFRAGQLSLVYAFALLPAIWLLVQIAIADLKYRIIPDQYLILLAVTGIGFATMHRSFLYPLLGLVAGAGIMLIIALVGKVISKKESLGFGDVKLMAVCGIVAGIKGILIIFLLSVFSSAITFGVLVVLKKIKMDDEQPLGPFICCAAAVYLIFMDEINHLLWVSFGVG